MYRGTLQTAAAYSRFHKLERNCRFFPVFDFTGADPLGIHVARLVAGFPAVVRLAAVGAEKLAG